MSSRPQTPLSMTQACLTWNLQLPAEGFRSRHFPEESRKQTRRQLKKRTHTAIGTGPQQHAQVETTMPSSSSPSSAHPLARFSSLQALLLLGSLGTLNIL